MSVLSGLNNGLNRLERFHRRYFARQAIYPWQLPGIMRKHIYTGAMGNIWGTLIAGLFFVYFGKRVGLTPLQWGLMNGIVAFLGVAQLLSALLTQRLRQRKILWFYTAVAERMLRMAGILVAWWLWSAGSSHAGLALIAFIALSVLFGWMAVPPWYSWLGDIIPEDTHGGFWGRRSAAVALAVVCVTVPAGFLMDCIPEASKLNATLIIFLAATVVGMIDLFIHGTIPEPTMAPPRPEHFLTSLLTPIRDRRFRPWLVFNVSWTFSLMVGASLCTLYFLDEKGLNAQQHFLGGMIVLTAVPLLGSVLTASWSGRLIDRIGIKPVLFWGQLFWSFLPVFWIVASPGLSALIWLAISSLVGGTSSTAAVTAANKLVTRFPPAAQRAMYVAVDSCLANLASALGSFVAGTLVRTFEHRGLGVWKGTFSAFHVLFAASLLLRLAATLFLIRRIQTPDREPPPAPAERN